MSLLRQRDQPRSGDALHHGTRRAAEDQRFAVGELAEQDVGLPLKTVRLILPCTVDATPRVDPCQNLVAPLREHVTRLDAAEANIQRSKALISDILERSGAPGASMN